MASTSPDIIFAQKATAIVKAAGLDPKAIDLETFRKWAPMIFTRAYAAIYKEQLISELNEHSNKEEQILNSQLVIDGLTTKTRNPALATISGIDIYQGNHRAIGILVGILFAEGQRLWLEKVKHVQRQQVNQSSATRGSPHNSPGDKQRLSPKCNNERTHEGFVHDKGDQNEENDTDEQTMIKLQKLYQRNQNVSPKELEKLLNRIAYLENRLRRNNKAKVHESRRSRSRSSRNNSRSPRRRSKTRSGSPSYKNDEGLFDEDDGSDDISASESVRGDYERRIKSHLDDITKQKKQRPSSAPTVRRVKQVSSRLYRPPLNKNVMESQSNNNAQQAGVSKPAHNKPKKNIPYDEELHEQYTYDLKSGRRILLSVAQMQMEERKRQQLAMGNVTSLTKAENDLMGSPSNANRNSNRDSSPTSRRAEYPGKRTEKSVEEWLGKMRKQLPNAKPEPDPLPKPLSFDIYQTIDVLDLIISVEHCHNCQHHNVSLRHDPGEYIRHADEFLRIVGQAIFQSGACVRLGVIRIAAEVTPKSKTTDTDNRIGAFEIQAACKTSKGDIIQEVIHSKLQSRRWPSKSVIEKRIAAFLSKISAPSICRSSDVEDYDTTTEIDGSQTYPGGRCQWEDTVLCQSNWSYGKESALVTNKKNDSITWIFDARSLIDQPKYAIGATVWIENIVFATSCVEKYALLGIVKRYIDGGSNGKNKSKKLVVRLKYCNQSDEVEVLESDCSGVKAFGPNGTNKHSMLSSAEKDPKLPFDLEGLLLLGKEENCIAWRIIDNEDYLNKATSEIFLCRSSYFRQVRSLSWNVILRLRARGIISIQHIHQHKSIDIFNNYSEYMLDYLFKVFGTSDGLLNVTRLMNLLPNDSNKNENTTTHIPVNNNGPPQVTEVKKAVPSTNEGSDRQSTRTSEKTIDISQPINAARPSIAKPALTRPSMLIKRPSLDEIDKIFPSIYSTMNYNNLDDKTDVMNSFKAAIRNKAIRSDDGILNLPLDQLILILHDFGLESIADHGASMKSLTTYFSTDGKTSSIKAEEFIGWLEKHSRSSTKQRSPRMNDDSQAQETTAKFAMEDNSRTIPDQKDSTPLTSESSPKNITLAESENQVVNKITIKSDGMTSGTPQLSPRPPSSPRATINDGPPTATAMSTRPTLAPKKQYQNKDLVISSIILEGAVLIHANYDSVYVNIEMENRSLDATVCLARERGSKRRSYNVNWGEIGVSASSFSDKSAIVSIYVSDNELAQKVSTLPHASNSVKGQTPNSVVIPMWKFFESSFEIKSDVRLPLFGQDATNSSEGTVSVIIHGHAHEAKEARKTRIMSMKPVELLSLRFDPLPVDDDDASSGGSDDDAPTSTIGSKKKRNAGLDSDDISSDMNETLFPKPSMQNLLALKR